MRRKPDYHLSMPHEIAAYLVKPLWGKVSIRTYNALRRGYMEYQLITPLEIATNDQLLRVRRIGVKSLAEIRKVYPREGRNDHTE